MIDLPKPQKQRQLLALLLMRGNSTVTVDECVVALYRPVAQLKSAWAAPFAAPRVSITP